MSAFALLTCCLKWVVEREQQIGVQPERKQGLGVAKGGDVSALTPYQVPMLVK